MITARLPKKCFMLKLTWWRMLVKTSRVPTVFDTIWLAGRNAPTRGEEFRVRLDLRRLKAKANWRVQLIPITTGEFRWEE